MRALFYESTRIINGIGIGIGNGIGIGIGIGIGNGVESEQLSPCNNQVNSLNCSKSAATIINNWSGQMKGNTLNQ